MFGKSDFSAFPKLKEEKTKQINSIAPSVKLITVCGILLFPSIWFWSSVILRIGLGTDYFFDIFFQKIGQSFIGNAILIFAVIFMPGIAVGLSGVNYMQRKDKVAIGIIVTAGIFIAAGFFAALKRG